MRKLLVVMTAVSFFLVPVFALSQPSESAAGKAPPVAPALVREGDFALKLVEALRLGRTENEAEAETLLVQSGIAPKNGWISDYPVTPDVLGELQKAVGEAAGAKRLPMGKDEAFKVLRTVAVELEIPIIAEIPETYTEGQPPTTRQYTESSVIDYYYYTEGPPVVTYYPPPPDYDYLYAWIPCPFFFSGFFFPGFFILHDFNKIIVINRRMVAVTNHIVDPKTKTVRIVDPAKRTAGGLFGPEKRIGRGFRTPGARKGAEAIFNRSRERMMSRPPGKSFIPSRPGRLGGLSERQIPSERGKTVPFPGRGREGMSRNENRFFAAPSTGNRSYGGGGFKGGRRCLGRC